MGHEYKAYRASLEGQGSGRRNRDEMRIAGINAAISQMQILLTLFQDYFRPSPNIPEITGLRKDSIAGVRAELIRQGRYAWPRPNIPLVLSRDQVRAEVMGLLASEGFTIPAHPCHELGLPFDQVPGLEILESHLFAEMKASSSIFKRMFKKKHISATARSRAESMLLHIEEELPSWERRCRVFEALLADRTSRFVSEREELTARVTAQLAEEDDALATSVNSLESNQKIVLDTLREIHRQFLDGDPVLSTIILQAAFSDNQGTAAPVGIDGDDLLIVMCVPTVDDVIWPEEMVVKIPFSAKKKTKSDLLESYRDFLLCHAAATAKEAVVVLPRIQRVRVIVLGEDDAGTDLLDRRVLGTMTTTRDRLEVVPSSSTTSGSTAATHFVSRWTRALGNQNLSALYGLIDEVEGSGFPAFRRLLDEVIPIMDDLYPSFTTYHDVPKKNQVRFRDLVDAGSSTDGEIEVMENIEAEDLERSDVDIADINEVWFWLYAGLLADVWDEDEVDSDAMRVKAAEAASLLFPNPD